jgi:hypothetical protein
MKDTNEIDPKILEHAKWFEENVLTGKIPLYEPCWEPGTTGYHEEREFIDYVKAHARIGYGRMIQMIQAWWDKISTREDGL